MKTILYIFALLGAVFVSKTDSFDGVLKLVAQSVSDSVLSAVTGSKTLEVRSVDETGFEKAISQDGRVVVVLFWDEFSPEAKSYSRDLQKALQEITSEVMLCKVAANRNALFLKKIGVVELPTTFIYYNGDVIREYNGEVNLEHLVATVKNYSDSSIYGSGRGSIEPLDDNWVPEGVHELESGQGKYTPL